MAMDEGGTAPLSLGFIGGSILSAVGYAHFAAARIDRDWQLEAGCFSLDPAENRDTAQRYGVAADRLYGDWRALVRSEKGRLDAIVVLTPTPSHFEIVSACLEAGFAVICEKALATSSGEARRLQALRDKLGGFLAVTYNYSGYPMVRELRQLIRDGVLGKIIHYQLEMPQEGFIRVDRAGNRPRVQDWRLHDRSIPTIYLDLAVHLHQLLYYLTGDQPEQVAAQQGSHGWFSGVVDDVSCLCRHAQGLYGHLWFSKSALGHRNGLRLRIFGTKASAEWYQLEPEELQISHVDGRRESVDRAGRVDVANQPRYGRFKAGHPAGFIEAFGNLYKDLALGVRRYKASGRQESDEVFGAELATQGLELMEAIHEAARTQSWQAVRMEKSHVR